MAQGFIRLQYKDKNSTTPTSKEFPIDVWWFSIVWKKTDSTVCKGKDIAVVYQIEGLLKKGFLLHKESAIKQMKLSYGALIL